jgi:hypothetical protein
MKKLIFKINSSIIGAMILFSSCEKVIDVDLNTSEPRIVIEGKISTDTADKATVRLSQSVNFDESNSFPPVTNAIVTITDQTINRTDTLKEVQAGLYQAAQLRGVEGHTYFLTIKAGDKTFTATTNLPAKVNLDDIEIRAQAFFGNTDYQIIPKFKDPVGIGNNYRFVLSVNDKMQNDIFVLNDELSDGVVNGRPLFRQRSSDSTENIGIGDRITLEMQCIDKAVYDYFSTLSGDGGGGPGGGSATPANPISNINGGALGYFAAFTKQKRTVVVK